MQHCIPESLSSGNFVSHPTDQGKIHSLKVLDSRQALTRCPRTRIEVCVGVKGSSLRHWQTEVRVWYPSACGGVWVLGMIRGKVLIARKPQELMVLECIFINTLSLTICRHLEGE